MSQITIRGIDPEIEKEIRSRAAKKGQSLNRVVLDMLKKNFEEKAVPKAYSLKALAGGWSSEEASQFTDSIEIFEQIDKDMWE